MPGNSNQLADSADHLQFESSLLDKVSQADAAYKTQQSQQPKGRDSLRPLYS